MSKEKYWILTEIEECVVCGATTKLKTRMTTEKPENDKDRRKYTHIMCYTCKWLQ